jgi:hypothetical protein
MLTKPKKQCLRSTAGEVDEVWVAKWLRERVSFDD